MLFRRKPHTDDSSQAGGPPDVDRSDRQSDREGWFSRLRSRLGKTKSGLVGRVRALTRLPGRKIDEDLLEQVEAILIQADLGVQTTTKIIDQVRRERSARGVTEASELTPILKDVMRGLLRGRDDGWLANPTRPFVILFVGVNGTGKTTSIGKLAQWFRNKGLKTMLVAADTFRAAAVEQLEIWARRTGSDFVHQRTGADPGSVCYDALVRAGAARADVVLIDTAGRLHTKTNLMEELKKIVRVIKKVVPDAPHETLLVLDATTGQNAIQQARLFHEAVPITGVVLTKLDGTAKGGVILSVCDEIGLPVAMIGIGEQLDDLRPFDPDLFIDALFEVEG